MRYQLIALNFQKAEAIFIEDKTKKDCINKFDTQYNRKDFLIYVKDKKLEKRTYLKKQINNI